MQPLLLLGIESDPPPKTGTRALPLPLAVNTKAKKRTHLHCASSPAQQPTTLSLGRAVNQPTQAATATSKSCPQAGWSGVNNQARHPCAAHHTLCTPWLHSPSANDVHRQLRGKTQHSQFHNHCRPSLSKPAVNSSKRCLHRSNTPTTHGGAVRHRHTPPTQHVWWAPPPPPLPTPHAAHTACSQRQAGWFQQDCTPQQINHGIATTGLHCIRAPHPRH